MEPMYSRVCMKRSLTCTHNFSPGFPVQQAKHVQIIRCLGIVSTRTQAIRCSTRIIVAIVAIVIAVVAPCYSPPWQILHPLLVWAHAQPCRVPQHDLL